MSLRKTSAPRPLTTSIARLTSRAALLAVLALAGAGKSQAALVTWDPAANNSNSGGSGTWDLTTAIWNNGATDVVWPNLNDSVAQFLGTGGTVTINTDNGALTGTGIIANGLTFGVTGYTIASSDAAEKLTLAGAAPTVTVVGGGNTAVISAAIVGTNGLSKAGAGILTLSGANTFTGGINISGGTLAGVVSSSVVPSNSFGNNAIAMSGGGSTLDITPTANTSTAGLSTRQFTTATALGDTSRIDFTQTASATTVQPNFNNTGAVLGGAAANLALQATGKLNITTAGSYSFGTQSDDGSRVFIDGVLVVNNDGPKGVGVNNIGPGFQLSAGLHDIRIEYVNGTGGAGLFVGYSGPDQAAFGAIPTGVLFTSETATNAGSSNAVIVGTGTGDALNVTGTGNSTVNLNGSAFTQVQFGSLAVATGSTFQVTGLAGKTLRIAGAANLGSGAGTVTIDSTPNVALDGVVSDGGTALTITKTGPGRLIFDQTATANTLGSTSTLDVQGGALVAIGSTASGAQSPIGSAAINLSGTGASFIIDSKGATSAGLGNTYTNNITITGSTATVQDVVNAATTTLSGTVAVPSGTNLTFDTIAGGLPTTDPGASLVVSGPLTGSGVITFASTRLGNAGALPGTTTFTGNTAGFTGSFAVANGGAFNRIAGQFINSSTSIQAGGTMNYLFDAAGNGTPGSSPITAQNVASQNIAFGDNLTLAGAGTATVVVNRLGNSLAPLFPLAANKTAQVATLAVGTGQTFAVTNTNGYGLEVTGATVLAGTPTLSVANANLSTVVPGLTLSGIVSGSATLTKSGAGSLVLANTGNSFIGDITVNGGALTVSSNAALGNAANQIILNGTGATLRASGTFATSRVVQLTSAANSFVEVTEGNILTLNTAFGGSATGGFTKQDNGTLLLTVANSNTGASVINGGVVRISNASALGGATATLSIAGNNGAALQIVGDNTGTFTVANSITINSSTTNQPQAGINFGGQLENVSGNNIVSGQIVMNADAAIGADAGSTLNINGGINNPTATTRALVFTGAGTINLNSTATSAVATNQYYSINKYGTGTLNITTANLISFSNNFTMFGGTTSFNGAGSIVATPAITAVVNAGAALTLDNSATQVTSRLGTNRPVTVSGGTFNFIGNAGGSTESLGVLTTNFGATITSNQTSTGAVSLTFTGTPVFGANSASILFSGVNLGTATNKILFGTAPTLTPATTGILARAAISTTAAGTDLDLVTYGANGIQAFTAYNVANNIDTANATDTLNVTAAPTFTASKTVNALKLTGTGVNVAATATVGNTPTQLTVTSGGILSTGGANSITAPALLTAAELFLHVNAGSTLTLSSTLAGSTAGLTKADGGTLILAPGASAIAGVTPSTLSGTHAVNGGTLQIASNNAIAPNQFLRVGPNATFDLNGKLQALRGVFTDAALGATTLGQYGTITSSTGTGTLIENLDNTARNFAGQITGAVNVMRSGENTWSLYSDNTYTGFTNLNGGTTTLRDNGKLSGSDVISINYATLTLDNNVGFANDNDRLRNSAAVTLRGGAINYTGRAQMASTETVGSLVLAQGNSNISVAGGGTGTNSADLTFSSLTQQNNATINFNNANGQIGNAGRLLFTTAPTLVNGILPYAVSGGNDLISYIPGLGVATLNATGARGYDGTTFPATFANGTQNLKLSNASFAIPNATNDIYELNAISSSGNATAQNITFADANDTLNLTSGALNRSGGFAGSIGSAVDNGRLTAGGNVAATGQTQSLYLSSNAGAANIITVNSRVVNNTNGDAVRLVYTGYNGSILSLASGTNSYTGGTVVNGGAGFTGTLNVASTGKIPAGGITLNQATLTQSAGGVIDATNVVTLNGGAVLTLTGNNTLAGLIVNNTGGGVTTGTVNTSSNGVVGTLTIGNSGITATSSNVSIVSLLAGRVDFGATNKAVVVDPILINGIDANATLGTVALQGVVGSAGGFTKSGLGSLTLRAQQIYTGPTNVTVGGLIADFGTANITAPSAGSRFSAYTFATGTTFNINSDAVIGSLAGGGILTNSSTTDRTFGVGLDNTSTTFSGQFARFSEARTTPFTVNKFGTGTLTLTGVSSDNNTLLVRGGGVTLQGPGKVTFANDQIFSSGTLTLDNRNATGGNVNNRLSGATNLNTLAPQGGNVVIFGNETSGNSTSETIGTLTFGSGGSTVTLNANANNAVTLTVGTTLSGLQAGGTAVLRGDGFGNAAGNGVGTIAIGALALGAPTGAGTGLNGSQTMPIRPDLIGGTTATSLGTAFITKDSASNFLRPLTAAEMATTFNTATATTTNVALAVSTPVSGAAPGAAANSQNQAFSLTLNSGGSISLSGGAAPGLFSNGAALVQTKIGSGGILALPGSTGISSGQIDTSNNLAFYLHTPGATAALSLSGYLGTTTGGLVKAGDGSVTINNASYYTGNTIINAGTVTIASGVNNTIQVVPAAGAPTVSALRVNGGTLELGGTSQLVGTLDSNNPYNGGSVRNSSAGGPVTLTTLGGGSYGGTIDGNLNFVKAGNTEMIITSPSTYTGTTVVRGNNLRLRDAGSLASSNYTVNYGGLILDNGAFTPQALLNTSRLPVASTLDLRGGALTLVAGGSTDTTATFATVSALQGHSTITSGSTAGTTAASTAAVNIGNLVMSPDVTLNFIGGTSGFFSNVPGFASGQVYISALNGNTISPNITNKILGGWAIVGSGEFATYVQPTTTGAGGLNIGISTMNGLASIPQTQYDFNQVTLPVSTPTAVVRLTATAAVTLPAGNTSYNALAVRALTPNINFTAATDVLNIVSGGLALTNGGTTIGTTTSGVLTSGGTATGVSPLYVFSNNSGSNNNTISAVIANNGAVGGTTRLVAVPLANSLILNNINTYTGGTVVNGAGGTLNLNGAVPSAAQITAGQAEIPAGGLTLNNALVTMTTSAGQIDPTNTVTLNGGSSLTLLGSNTLNKVVFNNSGGFAATNPTVVGATSLTLSAPDAISSQNDNVGSVPVISGTALVLSNAAPTIATSGTTPTALTISAPITSAGGAVSKTGAGALVLSGANTFTTGFNLNEGTLVVGISTTGTLPAVTNGPVGTGTMTIGTGTTLYSLGNFTVGNPTTINGDFTLGGSTTIANNQTLTLSGIMTLGAGAHTITVPSPFISDTISGVIAGTSSTGFTKAGPGTLNLNAANTYTGTTTISGGVLKLGNVTAIPAANPDVSIAAGAVLDINNQINVVLRALSGGGLLTNSQATARTLYLGGVSTTDVTTNVNSTFDGVINNAAGALTLRKVGLGTQTLTNTSLYTGPTTITSGTLNVAGSISGSLTTVDGTGATLKGIGTVGPLIVQNNATVAPGLNAGVLNSGNVTFSGGNFALEIFGTTPGNTATSYDQLNVTGTVSLTANVALTINLGSFDPLDDGSMAFTIINNDGADAYTGTGLFSYSGVPLASGDFFNVGSQQFQINYAGGTGNDVVLTAVPEPTSVGLLLGGLAPLMFRRRRKASATRV